LSKHSQVSKVNHPQLPENGSKELYDKYLINDNTAFDEVYDIAEEIVGAENIVTDKAFIVGFGSDDFAEYLRDTKGVYVHVGTSNLSNPKTRNPLHSSKFVVDEQALLIATSLHIQYALSVLKS